MAFIDELPDTDRKQLTEILLELKRDGMEDPLLPLNVDVDGDGIVDCFALDENEQLVLRSGCKLEDSVYESDGDDIGSEV